MLQKKIKGLPREGTEKEGKHKEGARG